MTITQSHRPGFYKLSLWDHGMVTDIWGRKYVWKKMKKPGLWDRGMVTGELDQKPDWKKWPSLSDSDMVTGGLTAKND